MSVLIISAIFLVTIYLLSASSFFNRFDALDFENKRVSLGLAEACVNAGILNYAQAVTTQTTITPDASAPARKCIICSVDTSTGTILVRALYNHAYTNLKVVVDAGFNIQSWQEAPNYSAFSGPACTPP